MPAPKHEIDNKEAEDRSKLLQAELTELNSFARHHFQLYLNWYTFFLTVNFVAIGWCTNSLLIESFKTTLPVILLGVFFLVQVFLSYVGSLEVRDYYERTSNRCEEILQLLAPPASDPRLSPLPPIPFKVYRKVIRLLCQTLISFGVFWIGLVALSIYLSPGMGAALRK